MHLYYIICSVSISTQNILAPDWMVCIKTCHTNSFWTTIFVTNIKLEEYCTWQSHRSRVNNSEVLTASMIWVIIVRLHVIVSHKSVIFILNAMRIWNLSWKIMQHIFQYLKSILIKFVMCLLKVGKEIRFSASLLY